VPDTPLLGKQQPPRIYVLNVEHSRAHFPISIVGHPDGEQHVFSSRCDHVIGRARSNISRRPHAIALPVCNCQRNFRCQRKNVFQVGRGNFREAFKSIRVEHHHVRPGFLGCGVVVIVHFAKTAQHCGQFRYVTSNNSIQARNTDLSNREQVLLAITRLSCGDIDRANQSSNCPECRHPIGPATGIRANKRSQQHNRNPQHRNPHVPHVPHRHINFPICFYHATNRGQLHPSTHYIHLRQEFL